MKKTSFGIKILNIIAIISGFIGMLLPIKMGGTISFLPLLIALLIGLFTLFITNKKKVRCVGCYLALSLSTIGILLTLLINLTSEPEVAVDKKTEQIREKSAQEIEKSDDLDDALDELDFE
ncbi:MAG: hypothetical protein JEZ09_15045 [Salinivirgaceae bacterium]|nr:hypothetical protein [Salinivirgaceae bacterium]